MKILLHLGPHQDFVRLALASSTILLNSETLEESSLHTYSYTEQGRAYITLAKRKKKYDPYLALTVSELRQNHLGTGGANLSSFIHELLVPGHFQIMTGVVLSKVSQRHCVWRHVICPIDRDPKGQCDRKRNLCRKNSELCLAPKQRSDHLVGKDKGMMKLTFLISAL